MDSLVGRENSLNSNSWCLFFHRLSVNKYGVLRSPGNEPHAAPMTAFPYYMARHRSLEAIEGKVESVRENIIGLGADACSFKMYVFDYARMSATNSGKLNQRTPSNRQS
jgi:hypothetical protein